MICIIQARSNSQRFPKKIFKKIGNISILQRIITSMKKVKQIRSFVIATTKNKSDLKIIQISKKNKINFYQGDEKNVASRYYEILKKTKYKYFLRVNGDSPFLDYKIVNKLISIKKKKSNYDILTNVFKRSFPRGQSVEIIKTNTFIDNFKNIKAHSDLEHVTSFFYKNFKKFKIYNYKNKINLSKINLSVDTKEDFNKIKKIFNETNKKNLSWQILTKKYQEIFLK